MREAALKAFLLSEVADRDGIAIKQSPMGDAGWPDWLVILPGARIGFLELKRPGEHPTLLQAHRIGRLNALGFKADYADSLGGVRAFIEVLAA